MLKSKERTRNRSGISWTCCKHSCLLAVFVVLYLNVRTISALDSDDQVLHLSRGIIANGNSGGLLKDGPYVKKRVIFKLRALISNIRSINRSLKREIERIKLPNGSPYYNNSLTLRFERNDMGPTSHTTERNTKPQRTTVLVPWNISSPSPTVMEILLKSIATQAPTQRSTKALKDTFVESPSQRTNPVTDKTKSSSVNKPESCQYTTIEECNRSGPCIWCISASKCLLKEEFLSSCYTSSNSKRNASKENCLKVGSCHSCVKSLHCVWCDSAEKCLSYHPVEELNVDCPGSKWYWRSCPYQPTVFLILLPVIMTLCLLILIAICIKYLRSHRKGVDVFHHEDHAFAWNVFKKRKSKGLSDYSPSPSERMMSKIHVRDCREKSPGNSSPRDMHHQVGRLSPNVNQEGKRRAASFGPSSSGSPKKGMKEKEYLGF